MFLLYISLHTGFLSLVVNSVKNCPQWYYFCQTLHHKDKLWRLFLNFHRKTEENMEVVQIWNQNVISWFFHNRKQNICFTSKLCSLFPLKLALLYKWSLLSYKFFAEIVVWSYSRGVEMVIRTINAFTLIYYFYKFAYRSNKLII